MPGFRPARIIIHPDVESTYDSIERGRRDGRKTEAALWKGLQISIARIRNDGQWGEVIPRIPRYFVARYATSNLYCIDLALFHRMFYTIEGRDVILLDLVDRSQYDKWFPGRKPR